MFTKDIFKDKVVLVTGGGSGIGYTIAQKYLELGAKVWIASRKQERIEKATAELSQFGTVYGGIMDTREPEQVENLAKEIKEKNGRLDILINNASGQFPSAAENISFNGFRSVVNNNLLGTFNVTKVMANTFFIPQQEGIVLNIIAEIYRGFPGMAHTGAARAGVDNLTKSLAVEWTRFNIRVNAIAPGIINSSGLLQYPDEFKNNLEGSIPCKRLGSMEEVAWPTLFLTSPMASYITGETLYVDGGSRLWGDMWKYVK
ncbi:MAG: SDR family oxidoreductase [Chitinophagales bacterium]|nr:SDR family oxidoreductase [Chitinophagales bacterium]